MAIITTGSTASELEIDNKRAKIVLSDISGNIVEPINSTPIETDYGLPVRTVGAILSAGIGNDGSYPDPYSYLNRATRGERSTVTIDGDGNLQVRAVTFSDEGSFRYDFSGSSIYQTYTTTGGVFTFTNGSDLVTVSGSFDFLTSDIDQGGYIKLNNQAESYLVQIDYVINSTSLKLVNVYTNANASLNQLDYSDFFANSASGSISVANSLISLVSAVTNGDDLYIRHDGDYHPIKIAAKFSVSQRIAGQEISFGAYNDDKSQYAGVLLDGTSSTSGKFVTSSSSNSSDVETTTFVYPFASNSSSSLRYQIDVQGDKCSLIIEEQIVAVHYNHIPTNYIDLYLKLGIKNTTTTASATTVSCDFMFLQNENTTEVTQSYRNNSMSVKYSEDQHYIAGELTTTTSTAGQTLVSYTVPTGKRAKIIGWDVSLADGSTATAASLIYVGKNTMTLNANNWTADGNILAVGQIVPPKPSAAVGASNRWEKDFGISGKIFGIGGDVIKILVNPSSANPTLIHYGTLYIALI